jgi:PBP1b-binding outer membrane lipoprotein LpoB
MIKRLILLLMVFLLIGCSSRQDETKENIEYIDPVKDIFIFSALDAGTQYRIRKANSNKDYSNYQFKMLFKDVYNSKLHDIMTNIYTNTASAAAEFRMKGNYVAGANIAGFKKVVDAMLAHGAC